GGMVKGRLAGWTPPWARAADRDLQQALLGVKVGMDDAEDEVTSDSSPGESADAFTVYTIKRGIDDVEPTAEPEPPMERAFRGFTRWNAADPLSPPPDLLIDARAAPGPPA